MTSRRSGPGVSCVATSRAWSEGVGSADRHRCPGLLLMFHFKDRHQMCKLDNKHKIVLVKCLARFMSISETRDRLKDEFDIDPSLPQIAFYQPRSATACMLSQQWKDLFKAERQVYITELSEAPMSHQRYRLDSILRLAKKAEANGEHDIALKAYEQASKEVGGIFTNLRKIEHNDPKRALASLLGLSSNELPDEMSQEVAEA